MEINDYCKNVEMELSQWMHKFSDVVGKFDSMPTSTKQQFYEEVNGLHIVLTEMSDRIEKFKTECSLSWEPEMESKTPNIAGASGRFNDNANTHMDYDFGG